MKVKKHVKEVKETKESKGKTVKGKKSKKQNYATMEGRSFHDMRKTYKTVKTPDGASETTVAILKAARANNLTPKINEKKRKIRIYTSKDVPVMKITGYTQKTPSVSINLHATEEELPQVAKVLKLKKLSLVWKQTQQGHSTFQYVSKHTDRLTQRVKQVLPVLTKRSALGA